MQSNIVSLLSFVSAVSAHGMLISPQARVAGDGFKADCGNTMFNTEKSDPFGNIQNLAQQAGKSLDVSKCQLDLCKGYKFADNKNIQSFKPGQTIPMKVEIRAPHTGVANVSVVDTASNSIIGQPLISFENYASTKTGVAANNTAFSVTLPQTLPDKCATAGNCVLQWWWDSPVEAKQTYMSCVDFSTSGAGAGSGAGNNAGTGNNAASGNAASGNNAGSGQKAGNGKAAAPAAPPSNAAPPSAPASSCKRSAKRAVRKRF